MNSSRWSATTTAATANRVATAAWMHSPPMPPNKPTNVRHGAELADPGGSLIRRGAASGQSEELVVPSGAGPQTVRTTSNAAAGKPWKPVPLADPTGALLPRATSL